MKVWLAVGLGGLLGSVLRYYGGTLLQERLGGPWPIGTFAVNFLGCLLIGSFFVLAERIPLSAEWRLFLAVGLCGGLTTFSSFSFEILNLLRTGEVGHALSYLSFSILFGLAGVWVGMNMLRILWPAG